MSEVSPSILPSSRAVDPAESPPQDSSFEGGSTSSSHTPKAHNTQGIQDLDPVLLETNKGSPGFVKKRNKTRRVAPMLSGHDEPRETAQTTTNTMESTTTPSPTQPSRPVVSSDGLPKTTVTPPAPASRHPRQHRRVLSFDQMDDSELHQPQRQAYQQPTSYDPYVVSGGLMRQAPPPLTTAPQHRRVRSHEQMPHGTPPQIHPPQQPPPQQHDPYMMAAGGYIPQQLSYAAPHGMTPQPPPRVRHTDPRRHHGSRRPQHHRVRSLPDDQRLASPFLPVPGMTHPGTAGYGGYLEGTYPEQRPYGGVGGYPDPRLHYGAYPDPRLQYDAVRPRASSYGDSAGTYGSFDELGPPTPQPPKVPIPSGGFSPRDEFRNLASGFSPTSPRVSPGYPGSSSGRSPRMSQAMRSAAYGRNQSERSVSFSPMVDHHDGSSGVISASSSPAIRGLVQPPLLQLDDSLRSSGDVSAEEAYRANLRHKQQRSFGSSARSVISSSGRTASSGRKMHMRQQSAQIYMEDIKGTIQPPRCRNVVFALLFVFHWIGIMYLGSTYSRDAFMTSRTANEETVNVWYRNVVFLASLCGFFAVGVSTLALIIMSIISRRVVQVALFMTISMSFVWGTIGIGLSPRNFVPITGIIALMLSVGYTFVVWDRVPFASANLHAALNGIRENAGTVLVAFGFQFLALVWSIYYTFVVMGVYDAVENEDLILSDRMRKFVYVSLGISYYWTFQVLLNVVQVTVASTIGSWWFKPHGQSSFCDGSVRRALFHSIFYEFGTICFGSLVVGPVRLIRQLSAFFRPSQEEGSLLCLHECLSCIQKCITGCVDALSDRFNPWSLTYVGLYGYGLLEAGHNATALFEKRGWSTIVTDDLVSNALLMASLVIGGLTGVFGTAIESLDALDFSTVDRPYISSFVIGCYTGVVITSVLFGIISSSVNAVIVCFAGSPFDFEKNHPGLSAEMRAAWRDVWPGCMDAIDLRIEAGYGLPHRALAEEHTPLVYHTSPSL